MARQPQPTGPKYDNFLRAAYETFRNTLYYIHGANATQQIWIDMRQLLIDKHVVNDAAERVANVHGDYRLATVI
jgi:hypothetical protein